MATTELHNRLLYDWLTVSFDTSIDYMTILRLLGLDGLPWQEKQGGSRLFYGHRLAFDGMSVHYTDDFDTKHNVGFCLEWSGQGCRDFETHGCGDWTHLFNIVSGLRGNVKRLDIAYDDFDGMLPIDIIADMAIRYQFTARSKHLRVMRESDSADPSHMGISVCHGTKSSDIYIRMYDKRVERKRWDLSHWVRCEVQLRGDNCKGFLDAAGDLGTKYSGVLANYLQYRCNGRDSNKARLPVSPIWARFLGDAAAIKINTRCDTEYNRQRLEQHIYDRNHRAIKTAILADGLPEFLRRTLADSHELPEKYHHILESADNSAAILELLGEDQTTQMANMYADMSMWADVHAINL